MELYCKACGTELEVEEGQKTVSCEFCGMEQTLPQIDSPEKIELFMDANDDRIACKFDVAKDKYEKLISQYPNDNEAYWCKLLCIYGIEYVDDALTEKKIPTCHRTLRESIFDNADYKLIISRATDEEKNIYETEAKEIDRIQKEILDIADKAEPYDIFICYKETDENNKRTKDSQIATKIYTNLSNKGYKVFFSRVTLKGMAGSKYEPVIYSALTSAKVLLIVASSVSNVNARWVRNEWSRYLEFMQSDDEKVIVPCISVIDAYDLPKELSEFQALNTADMDFTENLTRQIDSKFGRLNYHSYASPYAHTAPAYTSNTVDTEEHVSHQMDPKHETIQNYLNRAKLFLSDKEWDKANEYAEKILDIDFEYAEAYLVKTLCEYECSDLTELTEEGGVLDNNNYQKAKKFALGSFQLRLDTFEQQINYNNAMKALEADITDQDRYDYAVICLELVKGYRDASELLDTLPQRRDNLIKKKNYELALPLMTKNLVDKKIYDKIVSYLTKATGYGDADILLAELPSKRQELINSNTYSEALNAMNKDLTDDRNYNYALSCLEKIKGYKDVDVLLELLPTKRKEQQNAKKYEDAMTAYKSDLTVKANYEKAFSLLSDLKGYKDTNELLGLLPQMAEEQKLENTYKKALAAYQSDLSEKNNFENARKLLKSLIGYKDAEKLLNSLASKKQESDKKKAYNSALTAMKADLSVNANFQKAHDLLIKAKGYKDADKLLSNIQSRRRADQSKKRTAILCSICALFASLIAFICTFLVGTKTSNGTNTNLFYFFSTAWETANVDRSNSFSGFISLLSGALITAALMLFSLIFGIKAISQGFRCLKIRGTYCLNPAIKTVCCYIVFSLMLTTITTYDYSYSGVKISSTMNGATIFGIVASGVLILLAVFANMSYTAKSSRRLPSVGATVTTLFKLAAVIAIMFYTGYTYTILTGSGGSITVSPFSLSLLHIGGEDYDVLYVFSIAFYVTEMLIILTIVISSLLVMDNDAEEVRIKHNVTLLIFLAIRLIFEFATGVELESVFTADVIPHSFFCLLISIVGLVFSIITKKLRDE